MMVSKRKAMRERMLARAYRVVSEAKGPVSIGYVAYRLGVGWHVARALLLQLALRGAVKMVDTTKSLIFYVEKLERAGGAAAQGVEASGACSGAGGDAR